MTLDQKPIPYAARPDTYMTYEGSGMAWGKCADCRPDKCPLPRLTVNHIDGPYVSWCNGHMRWLTFRERVAMFRGRLDLGSLKP